MKYEYQKTAIFVNSTIEVTSYPYLSRIDREMTSIFWANKGIKKVPVPPKSICIFAFLSHWDQYARYCKEIPIILSGNCKKRSLNKALGKLKRTQGSIISEGIDSVI